MITRRLFLNTLIATGCGSILSDRVLAQQNEFADAEVYIMQLYAFTDQQKQFITDVVQLGRTGKIPLSYVVSCFQWARKNPRTSKRFYYFAFSLTERCSKAGISLPGLLGYDVRQINFKNM